MGTDDTTHGYCISSWVLKIWLTGTEDMTHRYCIPSWVLRIWLTGTDDMTHGYCISSLVLRIWLMGTDDMTQGYCISSWVLKIWLTGSEDMTHGYCIPSRVLRIWLTGNAYPHRYWGYDSRVLMIWLMGNAYPHGYCISSRVLHILTGTAYSLYRVKTVESKRTYKVQEALFEEWSLSLQNFNNYHTVTQQHTNPSLAYTNQSIYPWITFIIFSGSQQVSRMAWYCDCIVTITFKTVSRFNNCVFRT